MRTLINAALLFPLSAFAQFSGSNGRGDASAQLQIIADTDGDGVTDAIDQCTGTLPGEAVNTVGCSCSQQTVDDGEPCTVDGCVNGVVIHQLQDGDEDLDGVCDGADYCGETPAGEVVGPNGCSCSQQSVDDGEPCTVDGCVNGVVIHQLQDGDEDLDGVCDGADYCGETPAGENVNLAGCGCSQVILSDGDACTVDVCDMGFVTHTFLDADGDSLCDVFDACPGTTSGAGVNAYGCSCAQVNLSDGDTCTVDVCDMGIVTHTFADADGDGACDATDICPGTAGGQAANTDGCSCFQVNLSDGDTCTVDVCDMGIVTHTYQDTDGDGVCDATDICPEPTGGQGVNTDGCACSQVVVDDDDTCTLDLCVNGIVSHLTSDTDGDGVCEQNDACPGTGSGESVNATGCACSQVGVVDDGIECTFDLCVSGNVMHIYQDTDGDGVCEQLDTCPGTVSGEGVNAVGCACHQIVPDDGIECTVDLCINGTVTHILQDEDADGVCSGNDLCPGTASGTGVNAAGCSCAQIIVGDGDACTLDVCMNGTVNHYYTDTDGDGLCDGNDSCPQSQGQAGSPCDDYNASTLNDMVNASCVCEGTYCTTIARLEIGSDGVSNTTWEVRAQGTNSLVVNGGQFYPGSVLSIENLCLPDGCYYLRVLDNGGDGITGGGYVLKSPSGQRIIDNAGNFSSGSVSAITGNGGFCLPLGMDRLITASCDRMELIRGATASCSEKLTADNIHGAGNIYQFWVYDPNGTNPGAFVPASGAGSATLSTNQLPGITAGKLYNVKVRTRISAGVYRPWGPACRMSISTTSAPCRTTKLVDDASSASYSCGKTVTLPTLTGPNGSANTITAKAVTRFNANCVQVSANKYQFRLKEAGTQTITVVAGAGNNPYTYMRRPAFAPCRTYEVDVRASFDNGSTYCPYGEVCTVYTSGCANNLNLLGEGQSEQSAGLHMYPNPNHGDQLYLSLENIAEGVSTVSVDIHDAIGKRVSTRTIPVADGFINTVLELNGELRAGMYLVHITAGDAAYTKRLVIEP